MMDDESFACGYTVALGKVVDHLKERIGAFGSSEDPAVVQARLFHEKLLSDVLGMQLT